MRVAQFDSVVNGIAFHFLVALVLEMSAFGQGRAHSNFVKMSYPTMALRKLNRQWGRQSVGNG